MLQKHMCAFLVHVWCTLGFPVHVLQALRVSHGETITARKKRTGKPSPFTIHAQRETLTQSRHARGTRNTHETCTGKRLAQARHAQ